MIDTAFDFRTDAGGKDPDSGSPTLRRYHRLLWSKPLPSGRAFDLDDTTRYAYLHQGSKPREFFLASDSVLPTFTRRPAMQPILDALPAAEIEAFNTITYTVGGMMLFPGNRIDGKMTINGARGFHPRIADRFDLTLECIRRYYQPEKDGVPQVNNPLREALRRYGDFFSLFTDFRGYVEFFLLQDLVTGDATQVRFSMPFANFDTPPVPGDINTYLEYKRLTTEFVKARNARINTWAIGHLRETLED